MDNKNRIEEAFHEQTRFLNQQQALANEKMDRNMRWLIGLMVTMIVAFVVATFFQSSL